MSDIFEFIDFVNYARRYRETGPRRYIRDYSDPFNKYCAQEFQARYRFTPEAVKNCILAILISDLKKPTKRGLPFAPEIMVLLTLRYFATGSFQMSSLEMDTKESERECNQAGVRLVLLNLPEDEGEGLGFRLTRTLWDPYPWVRDVTRGSRAAAAGLRAGDCLLQADGKDLLGLQIGKVAGLIRGDGEGRGVTLLVWSCGVDPTEDPELLWCVGGGAGGARSRRALGGVLRALSCCVCGATAARGATCRRTHLYCTACRSRLERCALCREILPAEDSPYARNLVAEQVFEAIAKEYELRQIVSNPHTSSCNSPSRSPNMSPTSSRRGQYHLSMMNKNRALTHEKFASDPNINRSYKPSDNCAGKSDIGCHCQKHTPSVNVASAACSCSQNLLQRALVTRLREAGSLADLHNYSKTSLSKSLNNVSVKDQSNEAQQSNSMENLKKSDAPVFLVAPPPIYFLVTEHTK